MPDDPSALSRPAGSPGTSEQRNTPRVKRSFWIWFRPASDTGVESWHVSPLRDLTMAGARFIAEQSFVAGTLLDIRVKLGRLEQPLQLQARVAWSRPLGGQWKLVEHGVAFHTREAGAGIPETFVRTFLEQHPELKQRERRARPRLVQSIHAKCRCSQPPASPWISLNVLNISAEGLRALCGQPLPSDQPLECVLTSPKFAQPIVLLGHVVWAQPRPSGVVEHGIRFVDLDGHRQEQFATLIRSTPPTAGS